MSWQWVPAQLDVFVGKDSGQRSWEDWDDYRPGYFVGKSSDAGFYLVANDTYDQRYNRANSVLSSTNNWMIVSDPIVSFKVSAFTSADAFIGESTFYPSNAATGSTIYQYSGQAQTVYGGKPIYYCTRNGSKRLFYSISEGTYIIIDGIPEICTEPIYSLNTLSGGISGDHFWEGAGPNLDTFVTSPITFSLAGASQQYMDTEGEDYIAYYLALPYLDYYKYSSPASISALDEWPAGEYTNANTGEVKIVGMKCYKGDDGSVWRGYSVGKRSENWRSNSWGGAANRLRYTNSDEYGDCWLTVHNATRHDPYFVYQNSLSTLPNSFTLERFEWDELSGAYVHQENKDIDLELGPYQMLSSESYVLMGEVSQWR